MERFLADAVGLKALLLERGGVDRGRSECLGTRVVYLLWVGQNNFNAPARID